MKKENSKVFIAGAGGYLGTMLTEDLIKKNYNVIALDRFFFGDTLSDYKTSKNLSIFKDDIRYFDKKFLKGVDTVINLASLSNDPASDINPRYTKQINYLGAKRLAKLAKQMKVKKYIFASSCSVYGASEGILTEYSKLSPVSEYAKSKIQAEDSIIKIADKNFQISILRLATLFGKSEKRMRFDLMVNIMTLHAWKNNKIFILGGGNQWRPLLHLTDAIRAIELVNKRKHKNSLEIFNIGSNKQNYQTIQVANKFKKFFPTVEIEIAPDDPDPRNYKVNFDKAESELKFFTKKDIDEGIVEIKDALDKGKITESPKTSTHNYYKYLVEADSILNSVKLKRKLF